MFVLDWVVFVYFVVLLGFVGVFFNIPVNLEAAKFLLCKTSGKSIVFQQGFMWPLDFWTVSCCKLLK